MDRTPPTAADIKSLASDVARLRAKANEDFRVLRSAATEILFALDAMSERLANVPAVAPEDAFDVALHGAETVRATDGTLLCADCKATRDEIHGALCSVRGGATPGYAEDAIHAGPDGLKVSA